MSEKHTPARLIAQVETFAIADTGDYDGNINIRDATSLKLLATVYGCDDEEEAIGRRLVACWNACEKASTEDLESLTRPGDVAWATTIDRVVRERDEIKGEILVVTMLLREALNVVMNVEAESADEDQMLANLIAKSNDAIKAVLTKHAIGGAAT